MQGHSKFPFIIRKPAVSGTLFFGFILICIVEIIKSEQIYANPLSIQVQFDTQSTFSKRNKNKYNLLYPNTAKKILIAIHKYPKIHSLRELQLRTSLDSAIVMDLLLESLKKNQPQTYQINLNHSDSMDWEQLPGIGAKMAHRILHYRNRLGGFISKFQLLEIKYFDSSLLLSKRIQFNEDIAGVHKIDINHCDILDLYRHPYIGKIHANTLWKYKNMHSPMTENQFYMMHGVPREQLVKMAAYLSFR